MTADNGSVMAAKVLPFHALSLEKQIELNTRMWNSVLSSCIFNLIPIGSMYAIYGNIYHQYTPNVTIYTIHGSYGILNHQLSSPNVELRTRSGCFFQGQKVQWSSNPELHPNSKRSVRGSFSSDLPRPCHERIIRYG